MLPNLGPGELIIILVIALLVLGPKRLPDAGRSVGKGLREFKDAISGNDDKAVEVPQPAPIPTNLTAPAAAPVVADATVDAPHQQAS